MDTQSGMSQGVGEYANYIEHQGSWGLCTVCQEFQCTYVSSRRGWIHSQECRKVLVSIPSDHGQHHRAVFYARDSLHPTSHRKFRYDGIISLSRQWTNWSAAICFKGFLYQEI